MKSKVLPADSRNLRNQPKSSKPRAIVLVSKRDLLSTVVRPLDLHVVNVGSIPTGPTHSEGRLQPHPGDVLNSTPKVRMSPRSGLNLEGRLSDPQLFFRKSPRSGLNLEGRLSDPRFCFCLNKERGREGERN